MATKQGMHPTHEKVTAAQIYIHHIGTVSDPEELRQKLNSGNWIAFGVEEGEPLRFQLGQIYPEGYAPIADIERTELWFMIAALEDCFPAKSRRERKVLRQVTWLLRKLLRLEHYQGGGVVGLYSGWADEIRKLLNEKAK